MNFTSQETIKVKLNFGTREVMTAYVEILLHISFQPDLHFSSTVWK